MGLFGKKEVSKKIESVAGASVKILGTGCQKCEELMSETVAALGELGMNTDIEHVTELTEIVKYGVMSTPSLLVDGKVVSMGKVIKKDAIIKILKDVRG